MATTNGAKPGRLLADTAIHDTAEQVRDMIQHPEFVARGWPIGSGPSESRCKTNASRLKGRGRRRNGPTPRPSRS